MHVCRATLLAPAAVAPPFVIETEQMQNGGIEVVDLDRIVHFLRQLGTLHRRKEPVIGRHLAKARFAVPYSSCSCFSRLIQFGFQRDRPTIDGCKYQRRATFFKSLLQQGSLIPTIRKDRRHAGESAHGGASHLR